MKWYMQCRGDWLSFKTCGMALLSAAGGGWPVGNSMWEMGCNEHQVGDGMLCAEYARWTCVRNMLKHMVVLCSMCKMFFFYVQHVGSVRFEQDWAVRVDLLEKDCCVQRVGSGLL